MAFAMMCYAADKPLKHLESVIRSGLQDAPDDNIILDNGKSRPAKVPFYDHVLRVAKEAGVSQRELENLLFHLARSGTGSALRVRIGAVSLVSQLGSAAAIPRLTENGLCT